MAPSAQPIRLIAGVWEPQFVELLSSAKNRLVLCAPYLSQAGATAVARSRATGANIGERSLILTDLSPNAVCAGATDPHALVSIRNTLRGSRVVHLPRLHAKVYVADGRRAVVTSGNLTSGGLGRNFEYGLLVSDVALASTIERDIVEYSVLGAEMDESALARYCDAATDARAAYAQQVASASRSVQRRLAVALRAADDSLIRAQLSGGALHTVFARTIAFLLRRHGPLTTQQMRPMIQQFHPDLCDDRVDRVIDGKRYGKKWKHAVRTAQQQLKKAGTAGLIDGRWQLVGA